MTLNNSDCFASTPGWCPIHPFIPGHAHSVLNGIFTPASLGRLTVFCTGYSPLHPWACARCSTQSVPHWVLGTRCPIHPCIPGHAHSALHWSCLKCSALGILPASLGRLMVFCTGYSPLQPWACAQCSALGTLTVCCAQFSYCGTIDGSKTFLVNPRA